MQKCMCGELVVNRTALIQYAMVVQRQQPSRQPSNPKQFKSSNVCSWSRPGTSLEIGLRDDCSVNLNKSGGGFVCVFVILFA